jgi:lysine-specific demethylase 8/hypoxia-inducible factor 1-alpha inhibitor (HIF hydroxylase)
VNGFSIVNNLSSPALARGDRPSKSGAIAVIDISDLTAQAFQDQYFRPGVPIVVTGLLANQEPWTLDFLCQHLGEAVFPVRQYGRDRYQQDKRDWADMGSGVTVHSISFREYADLIRSGEAYKQDLYLARCSLKGTTLEQAPILTDAESTLGLFGSVTPLNLWCGPAGHTSCLHYDPMDGTLMQLVGTKQVTLFPPSQLYNLHPFSVWNHLLHGAKRRAVYSQVYPNRPDFESFPRFREALPHRIDVTLNPGEILLIPAGWWHEVTSVGNGLVCSVNRWWNVPGGRSLRNWSKWRAHLGSILGLPHVFWNLVSTLPTAARGQKLKEIIQRF